jgi:hypothetical protein
MKEYAEAYLSPSRLQRWRLCNLWPLRMVRRFAGWVFNVLEDAEREALKAALMDGFSRIESLERTASRAQAEASEKL